MRPARFLMRQIRISRHCYRERKRAILRSVLASGALITALAVIGCRSGVPSPTPGAALQTQLTSTPTAVEEATSPPSPSPTSTEIPGQALLVIPAGAHPTIVEALEAEVSNLTAQIGWQSQAVSQIQSTDFDPTVRVVIAPAPDADLAELAAANPDIQFVAIGSAGLNPTSNLSVIGPQGFRPDQQAFLAGYLAAIVTPDWRVGVLSQAETPGGRAAVLGFSNGVRFFCGLCRPSYPPFVQYPVTAQTTTVDDPAVWQPVLDQLLSNSLQTVYVAPGTENEAVWNYLADRGINLIGGVSPPETIRSSWLATVEPAPELALRELWPSLTAATGGMIVPLPFRYGEVNPDLVGTGRLQLAEAMITELLMGTVDTGVDPQTGDPR